MLQWTLCIDKPGLPWFLLTLVSQAPSLFQTSLRFCCFLQDKAAAEEGKAPAEPTAEALKAKDKTQDGGQAADDIGTKQISPEPSPAVSGGTPTRPADTAAVASQRQSKTKAKVRTLATRSSMVVSHEADAQATLDEASPGRCMNLPSQCLPGRFIPSTASV